MANEEAPWCKMPMALIYDEEITKSDLKVFGYIDHRCGKQGTWYMPIPEIVEGVHLSEKMVRLAIAKLRTKGFITAKRMGQSHHFLLKFGIVARTQEEDEAEQTPSVLGTPLPNSDTVFGNQLPNSDNQSGNPLPNTSENAPLFGNPLPNTHEEHPVMDYRINTDPIISTTNVEDEEGALPSAFSPLAPAASPLVKETRTAAKLDDPELADVVERYAPLLDKAGKSIVFEARMWRKKKPAGTINNFVNWLEYAIKPDSRASPAPPSPPPAAKRQYALATGPKRPDYHKEKAT